MIDDMTCGHISNRAFIHTRTRFLLVPMWSQKREHTHTHLSLISFSSVLLKQVSSIKQQCHLWNMPIRFDSKTWITLEMGSCVAHTQKKVQHKKHHILTFTQSHSHEQQHQHRQGKMRGHHEVCNV